MSVNTTEHLLVDMERLREHLGIEQWRLSGGSWGSTRFSPAAERHPERGSEIVIPGVTTDNGREGWWTGWARAADDVEGGGLFPSDRRERLTTETAEALARVAVREDGFANWSMAVEDCGALEWQGQIRLQWCHGGAGVVASTAPYLDEELLLSGAELVWHAGPASMEKGPGICHGTAGNGYALLRTFGRTGDERWLGRARQFAIHALGQVERWREIRGSARYSMDGRPRRCALRRRLPRRARRRTHR